MFNSFHSNLSHWAVWDNNTMLTYSQYKSYHYRVKRPMYCNTYLGAWTICPVLGITDHPYYGYLSSTSTPHSQYTQVHGYSTLCNSNTMGTNTGNWEFDYDWGGDHRYDYLDGIANVGTSGNLCTPYGLAAFCYDYDPGETCMWSDDGSVQLRYGVTLVGLGFGNTGAAWYNSTISSWVTGLGY